ncbi:hypothetical protein NDU88_004597 [Pleurodeles waltl]|uniref:Uncharacterized protein n=1 Tax=Pleurodeles waltl TaxID=8319 RepID=A0AAV7KYV7_PLEWA|nr:hypothetical protein NDU88_004597 [Pleurodeles waltl]
MNGHGSERGCGSAHRLRCPGPTRRRNSGPGFTSREHWLVTSWGSGEPLLAHAPRTPQEDRGACPAPATNPRLSPAPDTLLVSTHPETPNDDPPAHLLSPARDRWWMGVELFPR